MAATPVSFNCVICFEEFDADNRYPVVLPCGHTFVCNVCAERLDKCMECRASLFVKVETAAAHPYGSEIYANTTIAGAAQRRSGAPLRASGALSRASVYGSRLPQRTTHYSYTAATHSPHVPRIQSPPPKQRLPLPKNLVLLSLIEASESSPSYDESESFDENDIEAGVSFGASITDGASGTYVVEARDGLSIVQNIGVFPKRNFDDTDSDADSHCQTRASATISQSPTRDSHEEKDSDLYLNLSPSSETTDLMHPPHSPTCVGEEIEDDVDCVVSDYRKESSQGVSRQFLNWDPDHDETECVTLTSTIQSLESQRLHYKDRVQVVSIENGWAKLARGYGYVHCPSGTELVKVGGSVDKACQFEAMLHSLAIHWNQLHKAQSEAETMRVQLMKKFEDALAEDDDLTVVAGFNDSSSEADTTESEGKMCMEEVNVEVDSRGVARVQSTESIPKEHYLHKVHSFKKQISIKRITSSDVQERNTNLACFAFTSLNIGASGTAGRSLLPPSLPATPRRNYDEIHTPISSPSSSSTDAQASRRVNGEKAGNGIDFRTGLSGHGGLSLPRANPDSPDRARSARMSAHSGLTVPKIVRDFGNAHFPLFST